MNCSKAKKWMSLAMDNELDPSRRSDLGSHLADCPACRAQNQAWSQFGEVLRDGAGESDMTAEAMWQAVQRDIRVGAGRVETAPAWVWPGLFPRTVIVTACLALICAGVLWFAPPAGDMENGAGSGMAGVESVETDLSEATLIVYKDEATGAVVVWVSGDNGSASLNDHS
ncbi:MAG: zf-HC2 domain-containing protein [Verrucomicrobia bacterium]|nr:zf-HC2 domain-containing protein [Verrucomicrobiota bacterium]MDA1087013.1 zf-HC2 domain-containing protein [Verrucomicrobiota bacterium]